MKKGVLLVLFILLSSFASVSAQGDVCYSDSDCDPPYTCEDNVCTSPSAFGQAVAAVAQTKEKGVGNIAPKVLDCTDVTGKSDVAGKHVTLSNPSPSSISFTVYDASYSVSVDTSITFQGDGLKVYGSDGNPVDATTVVLTPVSSTEFAIYADDQLVKNVDGSTYGEALVMFGGDKKAALYTYEVSDDEVHFILGKDFLLGFSPSTEAVYEASLVCALSKESKTECADGLDNDGDGYVDTSGICSDGSTCFCDYDSDGALDDGEVGGPYYCSEEYIGASTLTYYCLDGDIPVESTCETYLYEDQSCSTADSESSVYADLYPCIDANFDLIEADCQALGDFETGDVCVEQDLVTWEKTCEDTYESGTTSCFSYEDCPGGYTCDTSDNTCVASAALDLTPCSGTSSSSEQGGLFGFLSGGGQQQSSSSQQSAQQQSQQQQGQQQSGTSGQQQGAGQQPSPTGQAVQEPSGTSGQQQSQFGQQQQSATGQQLSQQQGQQQSSSSQQQTQQQTSGSSECGSGEVCQDGYCQVSSTTIAETTGGITPDNLFLGPAETAIDAVVGLAQGSNSNYQLSQATERLAENQQMGQRSQDRSTQFQAQNLQRATTGTERASSIIGEKLQANPDNPGLQQAFRQLNSATSQSQQQIQNFQDQHPQEAKTSIPFQNAQQGVQQAIQNVQNLEQAPVGLRENFGQTTVQQKISQGQTFGGLQLSQGSGGQIQAQQPFSSSQIGGVLGAPQTQGQFAGQQGGALLTQKQQQQIQGQLPTQPRNIEKLGEQIQGGGESGGSPFARQLVSGGAQLAQGQEGQQRFGGQAGAGSGQFGAGRASDTALAMRFGQQGELQSRFGQGGQGEGGSQQQTAFGFQRTEGQQQTRFGQQPSGTSGQRQTSFGGQQPTGTSGQQQPRFGQQQPSGTQQPTQQQPTQQQPTQQQPTQQQPTQQQPPTGQIVRDIRDVGFNVFAFLLYNEGRD